MKLVLRTVFLLFFGPTFWASFGSRKVTWIARERRAAEIRPIVSTKRPTLDPKTITESRASGYYERYYEIHVSGYYERYYEIHVSDIMFSFVSSPEAAMTSP